MPAQETYYRLLKEMLNRAFAEQEEAIETAAQRIADTVLSGGTLYTFGTGHGHLLALEIFYRAGGLVRVCPMLDERLMLHLSASESSEWERKEGLAEELLQKYPVQEGDTVLIASNSGRNALPVEMAVRCREKGAFVIALTNIFRGNIIDVSNESLMIEVTGNSGKVDAFLKLVSGYEILELARTGVAGLGRGTKNVIYLDKLV